MYTTITRPDVLFSRGLPRVTTIFKRLAKLIIQIQSKSAFGFCFVFFVVFFFGGGSCTDIEPNQHRLHGHCIVVDERERVGLHSM